MGNWSAKREHQGRENGGGDAVVSSGTGRWRIDIAAAAEAMAHFICGGFAAYGQRIGRFRHSLSSVSPAKLVLSSSLLAGYCFILFFLFFLSLLFSDSSESMDFLFFCLYVCYVCPMWTSYPLLKNSSVLMLVFMISSVIKSIKKVIGLYDLSTKLLLYQRSFSITFIYNVCFRIQLVGICRHSICFKFLIMRWKGIGNLPCPAV